MRYYQVYSVIGLLMVIGAIIAGRVVGKLPVPTPHLLPIERMMPDRIGAWQLAKELPIDPDTKKILVSARILNRVYVNASGAQLELMLVTASNRDDIHDPRVCFPSQGWQLADGRPIHVAGRAVNTMTAAQGRLRADILYWMTGYFPPPAPTNPLLRWLSNMRNRLVGAQEGMSLFVRLMTVESRHAHGDLINCAEHLMPPVAAIEATVPQYRR